MPSITFGTPTGDPALAHVQRRELPGQQRGRRNEAAALYAVLTGRVTQIGGTARLSQDGPVHLPGRQPRGRPAASVRTCSSRTTGASARTCRSTSGCATRCSCRSTREQQLLHGLGRRYLGDLRIRARLRPEQPDAGELQSLPGRAYMTGVSPPTYNNLGQGREGVQHRLEQPRPKRRPQLDTHAAGWLVSADVARRLRHDRRISAGYSRAFDRRGMNDFTGVFGANPGLTSNANRNVGSGNLTVPLLLRDGNLGPAPDVSAACPRRNRRAACWPRQSTR